MKKSRFSEEQIIAVLKARSTELTSRAILEWQKSRRIGWHYIAPGKPMQNGASSRA